MKMNAWPRNGILTFLGLLAFLVRDVHAQSTPPAAETAVASKITDPKARAAVEEIERKAALINELSVGEMTTTMMSKGKTVSVIKSNVQARRPNLTIKSDKTYGGPLDGQQRGTLTDGKVQWQVYTNGEAMINNTIARMTRANNNPAEIQSLTTRLRTPQVTKIDLGQLQQAGVLDRFLAEDSFYLRPLAAMDPASLTLVSETPTEWILSGKPRASGSGSPGDVAMKLTVNKAQGLCIKQEALMSNGDGTVITLEKTVVNPPQPAADSIFAYQPPVGVTIKDATADIMKMYANSGTEPSK